MKKYIIPLIIATLLTAGCTTSNSESDTQDTFSKEREGKNVPKLRDLISDLTPEQEHQIEAVFEDTRPIIDSLRLVQSQIQDSIAYYNDIFEDHSSQLEPLYLQEAAVQVEINRTFYHNKLRIDSILTQDQRQEMISKMKADRMKHNHGRHNHHGRHHEHHDGHQPKQ